MEVSEIRNSQEYLDAFANYIRTGNDSECRTVLLSKNAPASGQLPVPDMLEDGKSGLLVSCQPESIAQAVLQLLNSKDLRKTLGANALENSHVFSADHMAQCYCEVYRK